MVSARGLISPTRLLAAIILLTTPAAVNHAADRWTKRIQAARASRLLNSEATMMAANASGILTSAGYSAAYTGFA